MWPGTPLGSLTDCTGTQVLDVVVSLVPSATATYYGEKDYTEEQLQAFRVWPTMYHSAPSSTAR